MPRTKNPTLTLKDKETARLNGIPISTAYRRIQTGMSVQEAITKPSRKVSITTRKPNGDISTDRKKSPVSFSYYQDRMTELEEAVKNSGVTKSQFIASIVDQYLDNN